METIEHIKRIEGVKWLFKIASSGWVTLYRENGSDWQGKGKMLNIESALQFIWKSESLNTYLNFEELEDV